MPGYSTATELMCFHRRAVEFWCHHYAISQCINPGYYDKAEVICNWQVTKSRHLFTMLVTIGRYQESKLNALRYKPTVIELECTRLKCTWKVASRFITNWKIISTIQVQLIFYEVDLATDVKLPSRRSDLDEIRDIRKQKPDKFAVNLREKQDNLMRIWWKGKPFVY